MRIFGGDQIEGMLKKLGLKNNESIDHPWINKAIERAQKRVEGRNFDIRKTLIKFDDVMNDQRQVIFGQRLKILKSAEISDILETFFEEVKLKLTLLKETYDKSNDQKIIQSGIKELTGNIFTDIEIISLINNDKDKYLKSFEKLFKEKRNTRVEKIGLDQNKEIEKKLLLQIIDFSWRSHIQYLEQLRQVIGLRSYGQKDPLSEFKKEAFSLFEILLEKIKIDIIKYLFNLNIVIQEKQAEDSKEEIVPTEKKVGRNEKCPCGSGKKFKHCCGNI